MQTNLLEILYQALNAKLGIIVRTTSDPEKLRQRLYAEQKKDPALKILSFRISPTNPETELLILKRGQNER